MRSTANLTFVVRLITLLALSIWLGGLFFFGAVAAPLVTGITRDHLVRWIGFVAVGQMIARFLPVLLVCGVLAVAGWWVEGRLQRDGRLKSSLPGGGAWLGQGICSLLMLGCLLAGMVPYARMRTLQKVLLPQLQVAWSASPEAARAPIDQVLPGVDPNLKADFDGAHHEFQTLVSVSCWLGLLALGCFVRRPGLGGKE